MEQPQEMPVEQAIKNLEILLNRVDGKRQEIRAWERSLMALAKAASDKAAPEPTGEDNGIDT